MLIITRRPGEKIRLGDDISIEVMEISGNTARIGIDAPRAVPVYREELWITVKQENEAAARTAADDIKEETAKATEASGAHT